MSLAELKSRIDALDADLIVLDVRERDAYLAGHVGRGYVAANRIPTRDRAGWWNQGLARSRLSARDELTWGTPACDASTGVASATAAITRTFPPPSSRNLLSPVAVNF